jgi:hypothetical protein
MKKRRRCRRKLEKMLRAEAAKRLANRTAKDYNKAVSDKEKR